MKIQMVAFSDIKYNSVSYDDTLKQSLLRMGLGFPIKIKRMEDGSYECVNGNKRCSAIHDILQEQPTSPLQKVNVIITNDARTSSTTAMNHH